MTKRHVPVMLKEVLEFLALKKGQLVIDCTLGAGGYARALAQAVGEDGLVAALDADEKAIRLSKSMIDSNKIKNIILYHENFRNLSTVIKKLEKDAPNKKISGFVFDLGLSSDQLADRDRGFSFQLDAPLNMAYKGLTDSEYQIADNDKIVPTAEIVNKYRYINLFRVIREYGEEKYADSIARAIIRERKKKKIATTGQLVDIIAGAVPGKYRQGRIHFATRTFQALRIETNDELNALQQALQQALAGLADRGRIAVVSFHSLEDRIVKNFFKSESRDCLCPKEAPVCRCGHKKQLKILTKKPVVPSAREISGNPRARSAKLRAAEKL